MYGIFFDDIKHSIIELFGEIKMAELICKDGTKINISDETEQELREAFGERTYPVGTWFLRRHSSEPFVKLVEDAKNSAALFTAETVLQGVNYRCYGHKKVDNIYRVPFSVIKELSAYPVLNPIKVKVVEDN